MERSYTRAGRELLSVISTYFDATETWLELDLNMI